MNGITIVQVTVTNEAARAILTTAIDAGRHGTPAWADVTKTTSVRGSFSRVELADREENGKRHVVTDAEIKVAVRTLLASPGLYGVTNALLLGRVLKGDFDGPLADIIVQIACFGKVTYA